MICHQRTLDRSVSLLTAFVLLLLLSGCTVSGADNLAVSTPTPEGIIFPSCRQLPCTAPTVVPGVRPYIDTWNNIHPFQNFDYKIDDSATAAKRYDALWGAESDHIEALRSGNPKIFLSYYIQFHRDWGTYPGFWTRHDLAYWKANHPDWILYKCDRVTPAYEFGDPNIPLDFSNPAFILWQIQTYALPASTAGYDGLAADNVDLQNLYGACGIYKNGQWVQRYTGQFNDPQWVTDIINWLQQMQSALHQLKHPMALIPNFSAVQLSLSDSQMQQIVSYMDGVFDEDGFTDNGKGDLTDNAWVQRVHFMEIVQEQNKPYYLVDQFPSLGRAEVQWALASYLMGKEHFAMLFISTLQGYGEEHWYNEYNAQIGHPIGQMYQEQNVYFRQYSNGLSIVNPSSTQTYTVTLKAGHHYNDLYGNHIGSSLTLSPDAGIVLLGNS